MYTNKNYNKNVIDHITPHANNNNIQATDQPKPLAGLPHLVSDFLHTLHRSWRSSLLDRNVNLPVPPLNLKTSHTSEVQCASHSHASP
jgi:hypothetical protein